MNKEYTYEMKKKLAARISKLDKVKDKQHLIKIYEIISGENPTITEKKNEVLMFFHKLNNETYNKLDNYIKQIRKKLKNDSSNTSTEKKEYKPYAHDDFPDQEKLSPKLKYSNREKNIIKRQRYDETINSDNNNVVNKITYCKFGEVTSDTQT